VLLVPLVRKLSKYPIVVHIRRHQRSADPPHHEGRAPSVDSIDDPFAQKEQALSDLRIKRADVTIPSTFEQARGDHPVAGMSTLGVSAAPQTIRTRSDDGVVVAAAGGASHASDSRGNRFRMDSHDYYSPLAEINAFLPGEYPYLIVPVPQPFSEAGAFCLSSSNCSLLCHAVIEAHTKLRVREPYDPHPHVHLAPSALAREVNPLGGPAPPYHPDRDHTVTNGAQTAVTATPAPAPAPTILQSMFSWWGPSTEAGATQSGAAMTASTPEGASTSVPHAESAVLGERPAEGPALHRGTSLSETQTTSQEPAEKTASQPTHTTTVADGAGPPGVAAANASAASSAPSAPAAATPSPMSKISERLQQIREQKVQYQQKNRHKPMDAPGV
jgi:hypothetical protein